jgi:hypothetical protein
MANTKKPKAPRSMFGDASFLLNQELAIFRMLDELGWHSNPKRHGLCKGGILLHSPEGREKDGWAYEAVHIRPEFDRLRKLIRGASPEIVRAAGAAFKIGSVWGALSVKQWDSRTKGRPEPDDYELFKQIQLATEKFWTKPRNRKLAPRYKDIADNWDRTCGFPITRQKYTMWRKSGVGYVCSGPRFKLTNPAS